MFSASLPLTIATFYLSWAILQIIYYAFFHPLSRYPGPRLAGVTVWWKVYIELVKQESLAHKLIKLHARYGACLDFRTPPWPRLVIQ